MPKKLLKLKFDYIFQRRRSSKQHVVLKNVGLSTAGRYKCEVSGEAPSFKTRFDEEDMVVVVTPSKAEIVGAQPKYLVGDTVNVTCFSYRLNNVLMNLYYHMEIDP